MRALCFLLVLAVPAGAQTITAVIKEGDTVTGVGVVTSFGKVSVNSLGQWIVDLDTDFANTELDGAVVKNGVLFVRESDPIVSVPSGADFSSFGTLNINDSGDTGWNISFPTGMPSSTTDTGLLMNSTIVLQKGTFSISAALSPMTPYTGFFQAKFNNAYQIFDLASVDDPAITSTTDRVAVVLQTNGSGALLSETVLLKEGDMVAGQLVVDFATNPADNAFNNAGVALISIDRDGPTATDGVIWRGGTVVATEGDPSPVGGRNWNVLYDQQVDLNDFGDWIVRGTLTGSTADDVVICKNNTTIIAQEGTTNSSISPFLFENFGVGSAFVRISNAGDVFYLGEWNDPDPTKDRGLFRNDELLVQEGVTMVGGQPITVITPNESKFTISRDGRWLIFEGEQAGITTVFLMDLNVPVPYCFGDGSGTACPCTPVPLVGDPDKGCPNSFNAGGGKLTASGSASISSDTLVMTCTTINNGGAVVFQGTNDNGGGAGTAFGDGLRCAAGTVRRMKSHAVTTNSHQYPDPFFGDNAISIRGAVLVPGDRYYQGWYRSGLAHCNPAENYNLTNGVKVTWTP